MRLTATFVQGLRAVGAGVWVFTGEADGPADDAVPKHSTGIAAADQIDFGTGVPGERCRRRDEIKISRPCEPLPRRLSGRIDLHALSVEGSKSYAAEAG